MEALSSKPLKSVTFAAYNATFGFLHIPAQQSIFSDLEPIAAKLPNHGKNLQEST